MTYSAYVWSANTHDQGVEFYARDPLAQRYYLTGKVISRDGGKLERHDVFHVPAPDFVIDWIDAGGVQLYQYLGLRRLRGWVLPRRRVDRRFRIRVDELLSLSSP